MTLCHLLGWTLDWQSVSLSLIFRPSRNRCVLRATMQPPIIVSGRWYSFGPRDSRGYIKKVGDVKNDSLSMKLTCTTTNTVPVGDRWMQLL
ncbi:hypothetical protein J6590_018562 [Homalodisca vitripennis]|nr:hypothetical protein J6590_018562 [Homalodisca vitripennis]